MNAARWDHIAGIDDGNVFQCAFGYASDRPEAGSWVLNFVERGLFAVFVMPKDMAQTERSIVLLSARTTTNAI
jgi:hypothetical protein